MEIFHVYYTCGKLGVTFVGNYFITLVGILLPLWELLQLWEILLHLWELLHLENFITFVGPTGCLVREVHLLTFSAKSPFLISEKIKGCTKKMGN